jgi:hypothetical protein
VKTLKSSAINFKVMQKNSIDLDSGERATNNKEV